LIESELVRFTYAPAVFFISYVHDISDFLWIHYFDLRDCC